MNRAEIVRDNGGYPIREGAAVVASWKGQDFTATVKRIKTPVGLDRSDERWRVVLVRDDDHVEVERYSDAVVVVVGDDEVLPDANLTAVVETYPHVERAVIRLSGRAGLQPVDVSQVASDPRTQQLRDALMAIPQVTGVAVVAPASNRKRNIVVHWDAGADRTAVSQAAWRAVTDVIPDVRLRTAFWEHLDVHQFAARIADLAGRGDEWSRRRAGYSSDMAQVWTAKKEWDGSALVDVNTRDPATHEYLYRTAQDRWVLNRAAKGQDTPPASPRRQLHRGPRMAAAQ